MPVDENFFLQFCETNCLLFVSVRASEGPNDFTSVPSIISASCWKTLISAKLTLRSRVSEKTVYDTWRLKTKNWNSPPDCYQSHLSASYSMLTRMRDALCTYWVQDLFMGTFRGSDSERSASQNRTSCTVVTTIVEKERFFWSYNNRNAKNHFKLSLLPPTHPKDYSQSLVTFTSLVVLSRDRAAGVTNELFRQSSICSKAGFSKNQCSLLDSCVRCT